MARRRIGEGAAAEVGGQEAGSSIAMGIPDAPPLGTIDPEKRNEVIAERQQAHLHNESRLPSGLDFVAVREKERADEAAKKLGDALSAGFFGAGAAIPFPGKVEQVAEQIKQQPIVLPLDEVTATHPEEMYGKPGTFSSYRVGPFVLKATVRPEETRLMVMDRLNAELREIANKEREKARADFLAFLPKAFG